jgi:hypothetical protein
MSRRLSGPRGQSKRAKKADKPIENGRSVAVPEGTAFVRHPKQAEVVIVKIRAKS